MNYLNCHTHKSKNRQWEIVSIAPGENVSSFHSIGIHPWHAHAFPIDQIEERIINRIKNNTLAIGEVGLDLIKGPKLEIQIEVLIQQIEISEKEKLPVIIHCVKAWNELAMIKRKIQPTQKWVFHGFAKANLLKEVLQEKMIISIGPDILKNLKLQRVIQSIPNESLLLETDDSSVDIEQVYKKVAELKGISLVLLHQIIEQNFKRIFPKWQIG